MATILDLRQGITKNSQYNAFRFPGGEVHFKLTDEFANIISISEGEIHIYSDCKTSNGLILMMLAVDAIADTWTNEIHVYIPCMPYQQADRKFSEGESFSLRTIASLLRSLPVTSYTVFDPHSDVTPALLTNCNVVDNSEFILKVLEDIGTEHPLTFLSPDAGAYKKIFKLADKIGFKGAIESANKYRDTTNGELHIRLSCPDFGGADILVIDDICMGGRTFIELAEAVRLSNVRRLYLAVSHGIFSNGLGILADRYSKVYTTNSRNQDYSDLLDHEDFKAKSNSMRDKFSLMAFNII